MAALESAVTLFTPQPFSNYSRFLAKSPDSVKFHASTSLSSSSSSSYHDHHKLLHSSKTQRLYNSILLCSPLQQLAETNEDQTNTIHNVNRKLYVYNLPSSLSVSDIKNRFGQFGTVINVEIIKNKDGKVKGYAFVTMNSREEAHAAIHNLDAQEISGWIIRVEFAKSFKKPMPRLRNPPPDEECHVIYASNLAWKARSTHPRDIFTENFKEPLSARVVFESPAGRSAGYGFVSYPTVEPLSRLCCSDRIPCSRIRHRSVRCKAVGENQQGSLDDTIAYEGVYGPWTIDSSDVQEVILYRSGLVTAAASFVVAASTAFLPSLSDTLKHSLDIFYAVGSGGLGLSLLLIHIYVSEIKRTLQALWGLGVLGSAVTYITLAQPANKTLIQYVLDNPSAVWLVGPLFAALTGLVFKEGLCYGKLEAGALTFIIPIVLLGHMTGLMDDGAKLIFLASWMALFVIFAGRKFTQPIKDDIGDKSVFMFNSLNDDERKALIEKLEQKIQKS